MLGSIYRKMRSCGQEMERPSILFRWKNSICLGAHNYENVMAAVALCDGMGVPMETIREGLRAFHAVEHRIEFVCKKNDIAFYNDSKGTNPDAAIKGICAMNRQDSPDRWRL